MFIHNPRVAPGKTPCQSSFTDIQDFWNLVRMQGTELDAGGESLWLNSLTINFQMEHLFSFAYLVKLCGLRTTHMNEVQCAELKIV